MHWNLLEQITADASEVTRVICPMVSRHFDFLESLVEGGKLDPSTMRRVLGKAEPLIGSAPVGPTTVARLQKYAGKLPHVRFGSTETCLQVIGTPMSHSPEEKLTAFEAGWNHTWQGEPQVRLSLHHQPGSPSLLTSLVHRWVITSVASMRHIPSPRS